MAELLTLPFECQHCGRPVLVTFAPGLGYPTHAHNLLNIYPCPYPQCNRRNYLTLPGTLLEADVPYDEGALADV